MPYKNPDDKSKWDKENRPAKREEFLGRNTRKRMLERILGRKLTWAEFKVYDAGQAITPDYPKERDIADKGKDLLEDRPHPA